MGTAAETLLIRADSGPRVGTGHVMRCLALAQAWHDVGGRSVFVRAEGASWLDGRLRAEGTRIEEVAAEPGSLADARQTIDCARRFAVDWIVLDGYQFDGVYQQSITEAGLRLLALDDYGHAEHYWADLVLNQNLHAEESPYRHRQAGTRLLLGASFALLRREFVRWRDRHREIPAVARNVLVTLGGSDPENITGKVIQALEMMPARGLKVTIVVGAANPHRVDLETIVRRCSGKPELLVDVQNMPDLMAWADVAVAAGGSSIWEMALLGLPSLGIGRARQETELLHNAAATGMLIDLGHNACVSPSAIARRLDDLILDGRRREEMSRAGRQVIDGLGSRRVVEALLEGAEKKEAV